MFVAHAAKRNAASRRSKGRRSLALALLGIPVLLVGVWPFSHGAMVKLGREDGQGLTLETMNPRLREMEYAVRGAVPIRAGEIDAEIAAAQTAGLPSPYNFSSTLACNIGNPHAVGQPPITFYRQVLSLVNNPSLLDAALKGKLRRVLPRDVVTRAAEIAAAVKGGTGAYSHSQGVPFIRTDVCEFIDARDGVEPPCSPDDIYLVNGASSGIQSILTALVAGPQDAVMLPIPQYPIYSAVIKLLGGEQVGYYLDEANGWSMSITELERAITQARSKGLRPRALVLINPGNPTGQVLTEEILRDVINFCRENSLVLLSDEVYQENTYVEGLDFVSARSVYHRMDSDIQLVSFHSTSKGLIGECGRRGGYMEILGFSPEIRAQIYKLQSSQLCPNLDGQIMTDLMVRPPKAGEPSYKLFHEETSRIYEGLRRKAEVLVERLNQIDGITCNLATGAMYAFVTVVLPPRALEAAAELRIPADQMYCLSLLESTGIITVEGSGFGQVDGTFHFRTTFLPPEDKMYEALDAFQAHHEAFMAKYS